MKVFWMMSFGEDVDYLVNRGYRCKMKGVIDQMMVNKVTINLNVFGMLVKNANVGNLNETLIIIIDVCSFLWETLISYNNHQSQRSSKAVFINALYSNSVLK